jgi:hypothetical protein
MQPLLLRIPTGTRASATTGSIWQMKKEYKKLNAKANVFHNLAAKLHFMLNLHSNCIPNSQSDGF